MSDLRPFSVEEGRQHPEGRREQAFLRKQRDRENQSQKHQCLQTSAIVLSMLLLGFLIYMLNELVQELSLRKAHTEAEELREAQRKACQQALEKLAVPTGVDKKRCMEQARDFRPDHKCLLECEEGLSQVKEVDKKIVNMEITCHSDGDWKHQLPSIDADGYRAEDLVCRRRPKKGDCLTGPPLDSKHAGQPEYLMFDYINKDSFWHVRRVRKTDFWSLPVSPSKYHHCNCAFAEEKTCSFQWSLGKGGSEVEPVESCSEDAPDKDRWGAADVSKLQVRYGVSSELSLVLSDYQKRWWCVDSANKPTQCKLLLTQGSPSTALKVLNATGQAVPGYVLQLDVARSGDKSVSVEASSMCQLLRAKEGPRKKYGDFDSEAYPTIVTQEIAEKMQFPSPPQ